jgi:hypothetical protein
MRGEGLATDTEHSTQERLFPADLSSGEAVHPRPDASDVATVDEPSDAALREARVGKLSPRGQTSLPRRNDGEFLEG